MVTAEDRPAGQEEPAVPTDRDVAHTKADATAQKDDAAASVSNEPGDAVESGGNPPRAEHDASGPPSAHSSEEPTHQEPVAHLAAAGPPDAADAGPERAANPATAEQPAAPAAAEPPPIPAAADAASDPPPAAFVSPEIPAGFANALFGRSAAEDLSAYTPASLARLVLSAYQHLAAPRTRGYADIRVFDPDPADDARLAAVSVVEVVNDDMPFLLDSTLGQLGDLGHEIHLVAHPILGVERSPEGVLRSLDLDAAGSRRESLIHIHVGRLGDEARATLVDALDKTFAAVRLACDDWQAMQARVRAAIGAYRDHAPNLPPEDVNEAVALLEWLLADNFTLLGSRDYRFSGGVPAHLGEGAGEGLGILRDPTVKVLRRGREMVSVTPEILEFLEEPHALIITKANVKSRVHRPVHMDYIGVKLYGEDGALTGELRVVGLFTASVYTSPTRTIPYIRQKVAQVIGNAQLDPRSHSGKVLGNVLDTYPRDELFQIDIDTLSRFAAAIAALEDRPRLRVLSRVDRFDRFASILVFIPRDRYDTGIRDKVGAYLTRAYDGRLAAVYPYYPDGPLVRVHYVIGHYEGKVPEIAQADLEAGVAAIVRTWSDQLREAIAGALGTADSHLGQRYATAFSAGYMDSFAVPEALADIATVERLSDATPLAVVLHRAAQEPPTRASLKIFSRDHPLPLSERVPILERMGFRVVSERTFGIHAGGGDAHGTWLHDMALERATGGEIDLAQRAAPVEGVLDAVLRRDVESDGYNALALVVGMGWRDIACLRTLSRYLQQTRIRFSQDYMAATVVKYAVIADRLVELVYARFDPRPAFTAPERREQEVALTGEIEATLAAAAMTLDEDRILRRFLNLVQAAVRTNFFQATPAGGARETISFKFESRRIDNLPQPHPLYEIYVHSPRVDGVHLRFGKVARGGLRWSDRPQDFRTEILALVKAQQVKNAVIVPVGAKGGFIPKRLPSPMQRDAWMVEGIAAYKTFVGALLDLTDNLDGDTVMPPAATIRHDGDDPYLVVAADKGTATFSDIANAISMEHRHWLGDAFASGGSVGYDHKRMGITARGAWEAVKRHFRELDVDIQRAPFTAVGIGDMSGDVFGNGMLLSQATKLVAAFDHRDIFIDPDPDPATSFAERARLFALSRSTWQDYDKAVLSPGGGIYPRNAREIPLSPQARTLLGITSERPTAPEVMIAILQADVDLLWFGGIGTYVRASSETDDVVGDRANDAIRISGHRLRCKVVGEGANLGVTQRGRIEAAEHGVRLNTDAIDNSAGVNTSDLEVNVKIALARPLRDGHLGDGGRRDLLAMMTDEVAALVLRNNYLQTLALSLAEHRSARELGSAQRLLQDLERQGRLARAVECLPDDAALVARSQAMRGLTRPELAVVLAYAKLALHDALLESGLPDDPYLESELFGYFPREVTERFPEAVRGHRLRREIIATSLANAVVNRCGPIMAARVADETGAGLVDVVRAFVSVRDIFDIEGLCAKIDALDAHIPGALQLSLYASVQDLMLSRLIWFVRQAASVGDIASAVERFRPGVREIADHLYDVGPPAMRQTIGERAGELERQGVPAALAARIASLDQLQAGPDIVLVSEQSGRPAQDVAGIFFAVDAAFGLGGLVHAAAGIPVGEYYERMALDASLGRIEVARRRLSATIVAAMPRHTAAANAVTDWIRQQNASKRGLIASVAAIAGGPQSLAKITVAANQLSDLAG